MTTISEGSAKVSFSGSTFFNPKMKDLRDISVSFMRAVGVNSASRVLDATSATGIRGIRYAREAGAKDVTFLEINPSAYKDLKVNIKKNGMKFKSHNISIEEFAVSGKQRFDFIDLDPFGSPAPYIYDIMKMCKDGTYLMVTTTDTAVLCGAHAKACLKQYGARPLHNELCKEVGLRIMLGFIAKAASQFNFGVVPLVSLSDMHYMRLFVRLESGSDKALRSVNEIGMGAFCSRCSSFSTKKGYAPFMNDSCSACRSRLEGFGQLWLGRLYDKQVLAKMLGSESGIIGTLYEELDLPLFYSVPRITKKLKVGSVSHYRVMEELRKRGAHATRTQFDPNGIKTDASTSQVTRVIKSLA